MRPAACRRHPPNRRGRSPRNLGALAPQLGAAYGGRRPTAAHDMPPKAPLSIPEAGILNPGVDILKGEDLRCRLSLPITGSEAIPGGGGPLPLLDN